jgi:phospholipid/cholesterol/gamma-HCH transport system substrate-binding protein
MKQRTQNIAVGITVIAALLILAGLILLFTGLPQVFQRGYEIRMEFERTGDAHVGDLVYLAGMSVGRITDIFFTDPNDVEKGVTFTARIDGHIRLPGTVEANMFTRGVAGTPYLALVPGGQPLRNPNTGEILKYVPTDCVVTIPGRHKSSGLIPTEVTDAVKALAALASKADKLIDDLGPALKSLGQLAENLNSLFADEAPVLPPADAAAPTTQPGEAPSAPSKQGAKASLAKLNKVLDGLNAVLGDPGTQKDLKTALSNLSKASAQAVEALQAFKAFTQDASTAMGSLTTHSEDLVQKLIQDAEKLSAVLGSFEKAMANVEQGKGTLGKLVYDNELYNNLVTASEAMTKTLQEAQSLLKEWKARGMGVKLK